MKRQQGFTIIELLIATTVFSVVLLALAVAVMRIGQVYYKGITSTRTQEAARSIIDDISRSIQFSGGSLVDYSTGNTKVFCIGERRYSAKLDTQYKDDQPNNHAVLVDDEAGCSGAADFTNPGDARELMGNNMRLGKFTITPNGNTYTITVQVVNGDSDLLERGNGTPGVYDPALGYRCKVGFSGSAFCAVSELTTTVQKRVQ